MTGTGKKFLFLALVIQKQYIAMAKLIHEFERIDVYHCCGCGDFNKVNKIINKCR